MEKRNQVLGCSLVLREDDIPKIRERAQTTQDRGIHSKRLNRKLKHEIGFAGQIRGGQRNVNIDPLINPRTAGKRRLRTV